MPTSTRETDTESQPAPEDNELSVQSSGVPLPTMFSSLGNDVPAALVVFLVAVPLCLGIATASGAPLLSGIVSGVIGGIVVSAISNSQVSVSGPAAGLVIVVLNAITTLGSFEAFLVTVVLAGCLQCVFGLFKLGRVAEYVPNSVIKGMMAGIGLVIILKQIPHALGRDSDFAGNDGFTQALDGENTFTGIILAWAGIDPVAFLIAIASLAVLIAWELPPIKSHRMKTLVPAPFVVVVLGGCLAALGVSLDPAFGTNGGHFVNLPIFDSITSLFAGLPSPDWSSLANPKIVGISVTLALVASIESLLSVEASDKLDPFRRVTSTNRELVAQGVGNVASGLLGGLPVTAVVVRSSTNIYAGGRTKASGILHGLVIACVVTVAPALLNAIPLASLAAILLAVGYKLTTPKLYRAMYRAGPSQFWPFLLTVVGILLTDLLTGVLVGLAVGLYFVFKTNHHDAVTIVHDGLDYLVRFNKDISFLNKSELKEALATIPDGATVLFDGTKSMFIDHDIYDMIQDFAELALHRNITIRQKNTSQKGLPLTLWRTR